MSLLKRLEAQKQEEQQKIPDKLRLAAQQAVKADPYQSLKARIHKRIVDEMSAQDKKDAPDKEVDRTGLETIVSEVAGAVMDEDSVVLARHERAK